MITKTFCLAPIVLSVFLSSFHSFSKLSHCFDFSLVCFCVSFVFSFISVLPSLWVVHSVHLLFSLVHIFPSLFIYLTITFSPFLSLADTDSSVDTEVVVKSPPLEAPVGRFKPKLSSAAHLVHPSFTTLILILGQQWTLNWEVEDTHKYK